MEAGASWPLVQPMVREFWVDAVFGTLAQDEVQLGRQRIGSFCELQSKRWKICSGVLPHAQVTRFSPISSWMRARMKESAPPPSTGQLPATERTDTPVFSQRLDVETVPVLPLLVNVHILLSFTRAEIQAFNDLWQRETGLHLTT